MIKAVITGDIIHSTKIQNEHKVGLFTQIKSALKTWAKDFDMKTEMFRGDSFQCQMNKPEDGLRMALLIKTFIRSLNPSDIYDITKRDTETKTGRILTNWMFDTRLSVGIGEVDLLTKTLANSNGQAFLLSGHLLDALKDSKQHLAIMSDDEHSSEWETESVLLDAIIRKTSALQCQVLNFKLLDYTETEIANKLKIGQSAVNQRSNAADWNAIETMVDRFETVYGNG